MERYQTQGEVLRNHITNTLISGPEWQKLSQLLVHTGRGEQLISFFQEATTTSLTGRLVRAGTDIATHHDIGSAEFKHTYREFISETLLIPKHRHSELFRLSTQATQAALRDATPKQRAHLRRTAQAKTERCYLCGVQLIFDDDTHHSAYSLDHVWPRSYGGDSEPENFLSCCRHCNNGKKQHYASWAMPSIQSIVYPINANESTLNQIDGAHKFAIHHLTAWRIAEKKSTSLKQAFQAIGPWSSLTPVDNTNVTDFFNLCAKD